MNRTTVIVGAAAALAVSSSFLTTSASGADVSSLHQSQLTTEGRSADSDNETAPAAVLKHMARVDRLPVRAAAIRSLTRSASVGHPPCKSWFVAATGPGV